MKRFLLIAVVLAAVMIGVMVWKGRSPSNSDGAQSPDVQLSSRSASQSTQDDASGPSKPRPRPRPQPLQSHAPGVEPGSKEDFEALITQDLAKKQQESRLAKVEYHASLLQEVLNLDDDQLAEVKQILEDSGSAEAGITPPSSAENGGEKSPASDADEQIASLLDPAQQQEYAALRNERRELRSEAALNRDVAQLKRVANLTPEQETKVRTALSPLVWEEEERAPNFRLNIAKMREKRAARIEALRSILTPEQLEAYQGSGGTQK